jgi:hypothetical protein
MTVTCWTHHPMSMPLGPSMLQGPPAPSQITHRIKVLSIEQFSSMPWVLVCL